MPLNRVGYWVSQNKLGNANAFNILKSVVLYFLRNDVTVALGALDVGKTVMKFSMILMSDVKLF